MITLLSDTRVTSTPVHEQGDPLVLLREVASSRPGLLDCGASVLVRAAVADRLLAAAAILAPQYRLKVVEGYRAAEVQQHIIDWYLDRLRGQFPKATSGELYEMSSRFVSPLEVAPHVAGAAVDLTLVDMASGAEVDMGTPIDATPEDSDDACFFASTTITPGARARRDRLAGAMVEAGFVNYPTEWWHWSYGDRYWAHMGGHDHALYGPLPSRSTK